MRTRKKWVALLLAVTMVLNLSGFVSVFALDMTEDDKIVLVDTMGDARQDEDIVIDEAGNEETDKPVDEGTEEKVPENSGEETSKDGEDMQNPEGGSTTEIPDSDKDVPLGDGTGEEPGDEQGSESDSESGDVPTTEPGSEIEPPVETEEVKLEDGVGENEIAEVPGVDCGEIGKEQAAVKVDNVMQAQVVSADYDLSFSNVVIGYEGTNKEPFTFQVSCDGATLENDTVTVTGSGDGVFNLNFTAVGNYTVNVTCITESGNGYLKDERTLEVNLAVMEADGAYSVSETSRVFKLDGAQTGTQKAFVIRCNQGFQWSESTMKQAQEIMAGMSLEEKVGQLFIAHYPGDGSGSNEQAAALVEAYHPGAFLVFAAMFNNRTPSDVIGKVNAAQAAAVADTGIPMFFSVDEEGGNVVRISDKAAYGHSKFPSQLSMAGKGAAAIEADALDKAEFLQGLGMNVNHAPVADVSGPGGYMYSRERVYGGDPLKVAEYVAASVRGHNSVANIGTSIKHFPGYGSTSSDTHNGFAINDLSRGNFDYGDLLPFYAGIAAGSKSVMVTHNIIECMDTENPASLSSAVIDVLRNDMNFDGVIMTDDLNMGAIIQAVGTGNAALACLQAGVDMPMCADIDVQYPRVLAAVNNGTLPLSRVEESCLRVLCWKIEMGLIEKEYPDIPPVPEDPEAQWTHGGTTETGSFASMWAKAVAQGGTVKLMQDVDSVGDLVISSKAVTLNLNGHKLHFTSGTNGFIVQNKQTFTLTDSVIPVEQTQTVDAITEEASYNSVRRELLYYTRPGDGSTIVRHDVNMDSMGLVDGNVSGILIEVKSGTFNLDGGMVTSKVRAVESVTNASNVINIRGGAVANCGMAQGGTTENGSGIGIYGGGTLNISGGYIAGNEAKTRGGGIIMDSGKLNISGGVLVVNSTPTNGGAVYLNSNTTTVISGGTIACNHAGSQAGGVYVLGTESNLTISDDAFLTMNTTSGNGGAVFTLTGWSTNTGVTLTVDGGLFTGNEANNGGAIQCGSGDGNGGKLDVSNAKFYYNIAKAHGGAIHVPGTRQGTSLKSTEFAHNTATQGGAICFEGTSYTPQLTDVTMEYNMASENGGAVYSNIAISLQNVWVQKNTAAKQGGGMYLAKSAAVVDSSTLVVWQNKSEQLNAERDYQNNLYLANGAQLQLKGVLSGESIIGVTTQSTPTDSKPVTIATADDTMTLANSTGRFRSDVPGYSTKAMDVNGNLVTGDGDHTDTAVTVNGVLIQYYSTVWQPSVSGDATRAVPMVNTSEESGAVLPKNGVMPQQRYLYLNEDGSVNLEAKSVAIYKPEDWTYDNLTGLEQVNKFKGEEEYYQVKELWVAPDGEYGLSTNAADWVVYPWSDGLDITTNPALADATHIYVHQGSVVRFVAEPVTGVSNTDAVFYDYDITDGNLYASVADAWNGTNPLSMAEQKVREQAGKPSWYRVKQQGINSVENYVINPTGSGHLAFGNGYMFNGWDNASANPKELQKMGIYPINTANREANNFKLCCFGIPLNLDADGHIQYDSRVTAPNLFDEGTAIGKTVINGHQLGFVRSGDTYTLNTVSGTSLTNLSVFGHPGIYDGVQHKTIIWSNNFWPLDDMETFGAEGHDPVFGSTGSMNNYRRIAISSSDARGFSTSDDGLDHNSYFGMQFAIEFDMEKGYCGPMEYYFFGDDDMWVFLDGQLVSDVGGVHPSAGSYVNLWDYISETDTGHHKLSFYFTERGASGSTCWMRFNLPHLKDVTNEVVNIPGSLKVSKSVVGIETNEDFEFTVTLDLTDVTGAVQDGAFSYIGSKTGTLRSGDTFTLKNDEYIIIQNLPAGTAYSVRETEKKGFVSTSTGAEGTIGDNGSVAEFTNTWKQPSGTLRISKEVRHDGYSEGVGDRIYASDGIDDACQVVVDFVVVNGTPEWNQACLTLRDEAGNPSKEGTAILTEAFIPEIYPDEGMSVIQEFVPDVVLMKNTAQEAVCDDGKSTLDVVGGGDNGREPDGIPDANQVVVFFTPSNEAYGTVSVAYQTFNLNSDSGTVHLNCLAETTELSRTYFLNWTNGGKIISSDAVLDLDFPVLSGCTYQVMANFGRYGTTEEGPGGVPSKSVNLACLYRPGGVALNDASVSIVKIATYESDGSLKATHALEETGIDWYAIVMDMQTMTESELTAKYGDWHHIYMGMQESFKDDKNKITYSGNTCSESIEGSNYLVDGAYVVRNIPVGVYFVFSTDVADIGGVTYTPKPGIVFIPSSSSDWIEFQFDFDLMTRPEGPGPGGGSGPDMPDIPDPDPGIDIPDEDLPL